MGGCLSNPPTKPNNYTQGGYNQGGYNSQTYGKPPGYPSG